MMVTMILLAASLEAAEPRFRRHELNAESRFDSCAVMDVDHDGKVDIVCGGFWYQAPTWARHPTRDVETIRGRYDDYSSLPLDLNGDGWTDLVSVNYRSGSIYWVEHPGAESGTWKKHVLDTPGPMETGRLVDVDGDGKLDILPNGVEFAAWWELTKDTQGAEVKVTAIRHDWPKELAGHGIGFGDLNGDGRADAVGPRGWLEAPANRRADKWIWHPDFQLDRDCSIPILVADVDDDGDADLIWGRGHRIGLYWMEQKPSESGPRRWVRHAIDTSWSQAHSLLWADFDGDGRQELVAGKRYRGHEGRDIGEYDPQDIYRYTFNSKARTWNRQIIQANGPSGFGLDPKAADVDGDGDVDLVAPDRCGLYWFENLGTDGSGPPEAAAPAVEYPNHQELLVVRDQEGQQQPVDSAPVWAKRRQHILANMQVVMGALPDPSRRVPLDVEVLEETPTEKYVRRKITFASEPGDRVPAYLLIPKSLSDPAPAMLCLHQTTTIGKGEPAGIGGLPTLHYAHELANRGYVCVVPDYPSFGDYPFDFKTQGAAYPSGSMKAIWNNLRAVDLLEAMPQVDHDRIGSIGHSLGGHNTLFTAAFDQRLRAAVTSCGFTAFHHYYGGKLAGWTSDRYMPRIRDIYQNSPDQVPFDFYEVLGAIAPRAIFVNAPLHDDNFDVEGVKKVMAAIRPVHAFYGAENCVHVEYPDAAHTFPDPIRQQVYAWLDEQLK